MEHSIRSSNSVSSGLPSARTDFTNSYRPRSILRLGIINFIATGILTCFDHRYSLWQRLYFTKTVSSNNLSHCIPYTFSFRYHRSHDRSYIPRLTSNINRFRHRSYTFYILFLICSYLQSCFFIVSEFSQIYKKNYTRKILITLHLFHGFLTK